MTKELGNTGLLVIELMKTIKKYFKMYFLLVKYAAAADLTYWQNLSIGLLVEIFYQVAFLAFFAVIFFQTKSIAGWGPFEIIVLLGIDTFTSELLVGMILVNNTRELPNKIWSGELDRNLLTPVNPIFILTFGRPYFPSFISALPGFFLIWYGLVKLGVRLTVIGLAGSMLFFILGFILIVNMVLDFSLLTFFFQDTQTLPKIGERIAFSFTSRPDDMFGGFLKVLFFFLLPVVYVSSFSAKALITGIDWKYLCLAVLLTLISLIFTKWLWQKAIKNYSSASS